MTIDNQYGNIVFSCDSCGEVLETGTSDFGSARNMLRRASWKPKKIGDDWVHACPGCQKSGDGRRRVA